MSWLFTQQWRDNQTSSQILPQYEPKIKNYIQKKMFKKQEFCSEIQSKTKQSHLPRRIWCKLNPPLKPEIFTVYTFMNKNFTPGLLCIHTTILCTLDKKSKICLKTLTHFTSKIQSILPSYEDKLKRSRNQLWSLYFRTFQKKIFQFMNKIFTPGLLSMCNASSALPQKLSISPTGSMTPLANF